MTILGSRRGADNGFNTDDRHMLFQLKAGLFRFDACIVSSASEPIKVGFFGTYQFSAEGP